MQNKTVTDMCLISSAGPKFHVKLIIVPSYSHYTIMFIDEVTIFRREIQTWGV